MAGHRKYPDHRASHRVHDPHGRGSRSHAPAGLRAGGRREHGHQSHAGELHRHTEVQRDEEHAEGELFVQFCKSCGSVWLSW